jgi:multidrug resistance efflux pump
MSEERKPTKAEMRTGGRVATVVLVLLAVFTGLFIWMAGR